MKSPHIKSWDCAEHDPIENWKPEDPEYVDFWLNVTIGIKDEIGGDNFQVHVVTSKQLSKIEDKKYILVIPYYLGIEKVISNLEKSIEGLTDLNWQGISEKISKLYLWEFKDLDFCV